MKSKIFDNTMIVKESNSAKNMGSGTLNVFSTPSLLAFVENTCMNSVIELLDEGYTTVGTHISLDHISSTPIGDTVKCNCKLIDREKNKLSFSFEVYDSISKIAEGTHNRYIVNIQKFMDKTNNKIK